MSLQYSPKERSQSIRKQPGIVQYTKKSFTITRICKVRYSCVCVCAHVYGTNKQAIL